MATDVEVQYFSHLNGLVLGNNWGDLIRLLDKALVTGIDFTQITAASIDAQGDIHITLFAAHNAMLFQVVELSGFTPNSLNQKYRIKGVPNTTQLILKPALDITERSITTMGTGKLASLGYDIIFRDANDVKRVYRAKNPRAEHPFIRVDETISNGADSYNSNYAKCAMVGLIENMTNIDDYQDTSKLQLPLDTTDFNKNWKITGTETSVVRGWAKWYWATNADAAATSMIESKSIENGNRAFTLVGDPDAFYLINSRRATEYFYKFLAATGIFNSSINTVQPNWFLMSTIKRTPAGDYIGLGDEIASSPLTISRNGAKILTNSSTAISSVSDHTYSNPVMPSFDSGRNQIFNGGVIGALEIPIYDDSSVLRGCLKHIAYSGKSHGNITVSTPMLSDNSMYIYDALSPSGNGSGGGVYFYLGELE